MIVKPPRRQFGQPIPHWTEVGERRLDPLLGNAEMQCDHSSNIARKRDAATRQLDDLSLGSRLEVGHIIVIGTQHDEAGNGNGMHDCALLMHDALQGFQRVEVRRPIVVTTPMFGGATSTSRCRCPPECRAVFKNQYTRIRREEREPQCSRQQQRNRPQVVPADPPLIPEHRQRQARYRRSCCAQLLRYHA
jgi:hypothetical protein